MYVLNMQKLHVLTMQLVALGIAEINTAWKVFKY